MSFFREAACPIGLRVGLAIRRSLVQVLLLFLGSTNSPEFNSSTTFVNSQQVFLLPVGIFNHVMFDLDYLFGVI